ncbi:MAG: hypothetical protein Q9186_006992 [Xanthomendoza sp. 1 TL-2023]
MSGVEALAVIGIIANVAGIVDFASKVLGRIKEASDDVHDVPKAFRDVQSTLPLLANTLNQIKRQIDSGALDEEACQVLKPVLQTCLSRSSELEEILEKCNPKDGSSKFRRAWKAVMSLRQDKKVEEISEAIHKSISMLTYHHHIAAPATNTLGSLSTVAAALSLDNQKHFKTYSMIPVQWAEDFTGREEEINVLSSKFSHSEKHVRVAVVGLGGIGKTRLVRQYVEQYKDSDTSVFWIHAGTADRMRSGSRDIAKKVGAQGCDDSNTDILVVLKKWFENEDSGKWLLIYDNVDDIDLMYDEHRGGLATHLPRSNHGSIILTTRNRQIGVKFAKSNLMTLSDLTQAQSISLMAMKLRNETTEGRPALSKLAEALGGIPLALVQATSFIEENHSTPDRYLELYDANESSKIDLLSQDFEDDTRDPELKNPIAITWIVTFEHIKNHQPLAADTLCLMSMFDAQAVPESLVSEPAKGRSTSVSPIDMERALGVLQAYSLITPRYNTCASHEKARRSFDIHRLVRLVTRNWLVMYSTYDHWVSKAIKMISARYDEVCELPRSEQFQGLSELDAHALILLSSPPLLIQDNDDMSVPTVFLGQTLQDDHASENAICPTCTANVLGSSINLQNTFSRGLRNVRKAAAICAFALGPEHITTLRYQCVEAEYLWKFNYYVEV